MMGPVHDERLVSLSRFLKNDSHPWLIPVGIRAFAPVEVEDDCARATVVRADKTAMDFIYEIRCLRKRVDEFFTVQDLKRNVLVLQKE